MNRWTPITKEQTAEFDVLSHMTNGEVGLHKFCVELGVVLAQHQQDALERLMARDWIYLIDISPACGSAALFRVFAVRAVAVAWYQSRREQAFERQA